MLLPHAASSNFLIITSYRCFRLLHKWVFLDFIYARITMINALIAGNACLKKMDLDAVKAPKIPATVTHPRKNKRMFSAQEASGMKKDQINPAARKPL